MKLVQYNKHFTSTVATDALVLKHQAISSYSAEYTPMCFQCLWVKPEPKM